MFIKAKGQNMFSFFEKFKKRVGFHTQAARIPLNVNPFILVKLPSATCNIKFTYNLHLYLKYDKYKWYFSAVQVVVRRHFFYFWVLIFLLLHKEGWQPSSNKPSARYPWEKKSTNVVVKGYNINYAHKVNFYFFRNNFGTCNTFFLQPLHEIFRLIRHKNIFWIFVLRYSICSFEAAEYF